MTRVVEKSGVKYKFILIGLIIFVLMVSFLDLVPENRNVTITAAIAVLMAFWWVTEALPIGLTSLLPIILFPAFGVMDGKSISNAYINYVIFLFIGGFFMALAIEKWDLHKRIALKILSYLGGSPFKILSGFMLASAFLSMWMSNTATAMMMLPIAFSVTTALEAVHGNKKLGKFPTAILLAVAYACSIGGVATLVGTPPNLSLVRIFEIIYPNAPQITFGQWFIFAFPFSIIMLVLVLLLLFFMFPVNKDIEVMNKSFFKEKYKELGSITIEQKRVFVLFILLVFMWVFSHNITVGNFTIPGWSSLFKNPQFINDGTIAIFISLLLFIVPSSNKKEGLITWEIIPKIPWGIVFLFGGGFALANGFIESGLSKYVGEKLVAAGNLGDVNLLIVVSSLITSLTEFTSNTATTEMMLPIVSGLANQIQINPLFLMIPVALSASMAFMFPVATPPNAIVFGTGKLKIMDMVKAGIFVNILGVILIVIFMYFWGTIVFDIDINAMPSWVDTIPLIKQ